MCEITISRIKNEIRNGGRISGIKIYPEDNSGTKSITFSDSLFSGFGIKSQAGDLVYKDGFSEVNVTILASLLREYIGKRIYAHLYKNGLDIELDGKLTENSLKK